MDQNETKDTHLHRRHHTPMPESYKEVIKVEDADDLTKSIPEESIGPDGKKQYENADELGKDLSISMDEDFSLEPYEKKYRRSHHRSDEELSPEERKEREKERRKKEKLAKKKKTSPLKVIAIILAIIAFLILAAIAAFFIVRAIGKKNLDNVVVEESVEAPEDVVYENDGKTVIYKGEKYCYNENVISILCLGLDKNKSLTSEETIGSNGQADALFLAVLDKSTGKLSFVVINRDTMTSMKTYKPGGEATGIVNQQICLSYAYGDGGETSAMNTASSVSALLYGMPIHAYAALDYFGVSALNNAIGGVTVTCIEDLSNMYSKFEMGKTLTLEGQEAINYIRMRGTGVESASRRTERQKQYLTNFIKQTINEIKTNPGIIASLYDIAGVYMVTDIGLPEVTYLATVVAQNGFSGTDIFSVPGEATLGEDGFVQFHADKDQLYEIVLNVFYTKEDK